MPAFGGIGVLRRDDKAQDFSTSIVPDDGRSGRLFAVRYVDSFCDAESFIDVYRLLEFAVTERWRPTPAACFGRLALVGPIHLGVDRLALEVASHDLLGHFSFAALIV